MIPRIATAATNTTKPCSRCSSTLLQLLIPYFYYLPALGSPESSRGYGNWPVWPSGRGDWGESNRPATNYPGIPADANRVDCLVEKGDLVTEVHR